jgi:hypothetical protein
MRSVPELNRRGQKATRDIICRLLPVQLTEPFKARNPANGAQGVHNIASIFSRLIIKEQP